MIYYHFNIPTEGPFRCADTHNVVQQTVPVLNKDSKHAWESPYAAFTFSLILSINKTLIASVNTSI